MAYSNAIQIYAIYDDDAQGAFAFVVLSITHGLPLLILRLSLCPVRNDNLVFHLWSSTIDYLLCNRLPYHLGIRTLAMAIEAYRCTLYISDIVGRSCCYSVHF